MRGLVIKNTGSWYQVKNTETNETTECKIKGNLRLKDIRSTNPIAVGDFVQYLLNDDGTGMISAIDDRRNYIVRRSSNLSKQSHILATNLDLVVLVATINYPITSTTFIDRFLASAEAYRVPACIVINKVDLYTKEEIEYLEAIKYLYESLNYPVFAISAKNSQDITEVTNFLKAKTALFSGNSGVGKSTLINAIAVRPIAKTGEISSYHNKGMHTTTFSEMFELPNGARIIDTPGIKGFGAVDMEVGEISHYFKEIFQISRDCRFSDCTHTTEPGCAVQRALEKQLISKSRYQSYLSMLSDFDSGKYR
ncbi:MAG: ribosome small subunit-dependent GTPase A [Paludibacteraceae bacterium]|nr:ribosome small subunit-dependent GTPase A [Paludibacteraceae bacterium]